MATDGPRQFLPSKLIEWIDLLVKVGAVFAAVFAVHQYMQARADARVANTLDYVSEFRDGRSRTGLAVKQISEAMWRDADQIREFQWLAGQLPPDQRDEAIRTMIAKFIYGTDESPGLRSEVDEIVSFFEALTICMEARLCDRATARAFFADYADVFWRNFDVYLVDQRALVADYAEGVERFAGAFSQAAGTADLMELPRESLNP